MNIKEQKRIWIAHKPYSQDVRVSVHYCPICELWVVEQNEIRVIVCSHLCLKNVEFNHNSWKISGFISTFKEVRDKHNDMGHSENDTFEMTVVSLDKDGFKTELNLPIYRCPYLDMVSYDKDSMLAIYPTNQIE